MAARKVQTPLPVAVSQTPSPALASLPSPLLLTVKLVELQLTVPMAKKLNELIASETIVDPDIVPPIEAYAPPWVADLPMRLLLFRVTAESVSRTFVLVNEADAVAVQ